MKYDVFISYSSQDQKIVDGICNYLETHGISCFVAYRDIPRGVVWAGAIVDALDESTMMLVVFSESFNESKQVDREIELASMDDKPILTFRLENVNFKGAKKYYLQNLNWIDGFPNPDSAYGELYSNICKLLGKEEVALSSSTNPITSTTSTHFISQSSEDNENQTREKPQEIAPTEQNSNIYCEPQLSVDPQIGEFQLKNDKNTERKYINGYEYVDLGLPSGLKWATCNVGALRPEEYGDYFAWGDTMTKSRYTDDNSVTYGMYGKWYQKRIDKDKDWLFKNCYIDRYGNLTFEHDAAQQNWGGGWRMPTSKEIDELINNTTTAWVTLNGVKGRLVKSKKNGNFIFLPAAGYRHDSSLRYTGEYGRYWSSTPYEGLSSSAYHLYFNSSDFKLDWRSRYLGFSVRPVSE